MISIENILCDIEINGDYCEVTLEYSQNKIFHSKRSSRLVLNYLRGDAILERKLLKGQILNKKFKINDLLNEDKIVELIRPFVLPRKINDSLYPYQRHGVSWLLHKKRGILADDMGLGKTYQAISAARRLIRFGEINWTLVVAPKSLLNTWLDEFNKWAPELKTCIFTRAEMQKGYSWTRLINSNHILITTYETLRGDINQIHENSPDLVIADEAHRLRKKESLTFQAFKTLKSRYLWFLSGTPIERSSEDLVVMLSIIEPRQFSQNDKSIHRISLQAQARNFFLRRTKNEVLSELPPVIERLETLELTESQRKSYENVLRSNYVNYLSKFSKLREICDYDEESDESSKIDRILEIAQDIADNKEKVVVFSYTLKPLSILAEKLNIEGILFTTILGDQSIEIRKQVIDQFKNDSKVTVLLASTKVASEGITLTEANNVIFMNKWWNPSSNNQARDRVVRIGQTKKVNVIGFKIKNTLEENLEKILENKQKTFDQVMAAVTLGDFEKVL
jgi:SNF2 family DNA or RNA helicase